jgi:hypothetical protein
MQQSKVFIFNSNEKDLQHVYIWFHHNVQWWNDLKGRSKKSRKISHAPERIKSWKEREGVEEEMNKIWIFHIKSFRIYENMELAYFA